MSSTSPQSFVSPGSATPRDPVPMLDLTRQYETIKDDVHAAIERVLTSQHFIGGPELEGFERESASYLGVSASVGCASGTDALWLALAASGVGPEACVITTPFSFFATVSSIVRCGATPVLVDIDPATLTLDPGATERALQRARSYKFRAVMPVHLYGQCANMDKFSRLAEQYDASLIEDAAQAFGAKWRDKKAGAMGKAAAFSFYPTKNLSAYGDGGCVTTNDEELAAHVRRLRNHGSRHRYYHEEIGWNSRLDAMQAAVLRVKLKHIDDWNQARRMLARRYQGLFISSGLARSGEQSVGTQAPIALLATVPEAYHIYHQYVVRAFRREELRTFLTQQGIGMEIYYPVPLHLQECFTYLGYKAGDLPESERASREVLALPMFPELREDEQQRVVAAIAEFYSR
ncbi:MAG: DegT/DnrJ/EryC1/StrS family aminotransferase [Terriglobales bacterium]